MAFFYQCCRTITIFSGSEFWQVTVLVLATGPAPYLDHNFILLRLRFRFHNRNRNRNYLRFRFRWDKKLRFLRFRYTIFYIFGRYGRCWRTLWSGCPRALLWPSSGTTSGSSGPTQSIRQVTPRRQGFRIRIRIDLSCLIRIQVHKLD